jgi:hypothetical protein
MLGSSYFDTFAIGYAVRRLSPDLPVGRTLRLEHACPFGGDICRASLWFVLILPPEACKSSGGIGFELRQLA